MFQYVSGLLFNKIEKLRQNAGNAQEKQDAKFRGHENVFPPPVSAQLKVVLVLEHSELPPYELLTDLAAALSPGTALLLTGPASPPHHSHPASELDLVSGWAWQPHRQQALIERLLCLQAVERLKGSVPVHAQRARSLFCLSVVEEQQSPFSL